MTELTLEEELDQIEQEEYLDAIAPIENPRDLEAFARSLYLPPVKVTDTPEIYNPDGHLVQLLALREFQSTRWRKFVVVACTQDGKSWLIQIVIFYYGTELREAVVVGGPDMRIAQDTWRQKTKPAMEASGLKHFLPTSGPGSAGGSDVETIQLNGGGLLILLGAGGKNASGQAGRTSRAVIVDEFGKVKKKLAGKFDRRADSFQEDGRIWKAGTVEADRDDTLLAAYEQSSQGRMAWRCPHCRGFIRLEWEMVTADYATEFTAAESARIACSRCDVLWTDDDRVKRALKDGRLVHAGQEVDAQGRITGPEPETFTCGILWSALDSPRRSLAILAVEFRNASIEYEKGNAQPLIDFYHDQLARCAPVDDGTEAVDAAKLAARSSVSTYSVVQLLDGDGNNAYQFQVARIPPGVHFTTVAVDQSLRRLWYVIRGHDADGRTWWLGWGRIPIVGDLEQPNKQQRWAALDRIKALVSRGLPPPIAGEAYVPVVVGVDTGDFTSDTFEWLKKNPGWIALRGTGDRQAQGMTANTGREQYSEPGWYTLRVYDAGREVLWIDSDRVKTEFNRALGRPIADPPGIGAPGSAHLPNGLAKDDHLLAQLTSEQWLKAPGGRWTWMKKYRFNDLWDGGYYTQALGKYVRDRLPHKALPPDTKPPPSGGGGDDGRDDFGSHMAGGW